MKRANFPDRKDRRRVEAAARQAAYDELSDAEKAERNPGKARRRDQ